MADIRKEVAVGIRIEDDPQGVAAATTSLEDLRNQIGADMRALRAMSGAMRDLKADSSTSATTIQSLKDQIDAHKIVIAQTQAKYIELGGTFRETSTSAKAVGDAAAASGAKQGAASEAAALKASQLAQRARDVETAMSRLSSLSPPQLAATIRQDEASVRELTAALARLGGEMNATGDDAKRLKTELNAKRATVDAAQRLYLKTGGSLSDLQKRTTQTSASLGQLGGVFGVAGGQIGSLGGKVGALDAALRAGAAGGITLGVIALAALATAAFAAVGALAAFGLAQSNTRRQQQLSTEAFVRSTNGVKAWEAATFSASAVARNFGAAVDNTATKTLLARDKVNGLAESLYKSNIRGEDFQDVLTAAAQVALVSGDAAAQSFVKHAAATQAAGKSVKDLAKTVDSEIGGLAAAKVLEFGNIMASLKTTVAGLFSGLKIDGFLRALQFITSQFDEQHAIGGAIRTMFETLFQPMVDSATGAAPTVKRLIQGIVIAALQTTIVFLKVRNSIRDAFGDSTILGKISGLFDAVSVGKFVFYGIAGVLALTAAAMASIAAPLAFVTFGLYNLYRAGAAVWDFFASFEWSKIGDAVVEGILGILTAAPARFVAAAKSLAGALSGGFKSALGISSPSKVFAYYGKMTTDGYKGSIESETPRVQASVNDMVRAPDTPEIEPVVRPRVITPRRQSEANAPGILSRGATLRAGTVSPRQATQATPTAGIGRRARDVGERPTFNVPRPAVSFSFGAPASERDDAPRPPDQPVGRPPGPAPIPLQSRPIDQRPTNTSTTNNTSRSETVRIDQLIVQVGAGTNAAEAQQVGQAAGKAAATALEQQLIAALRRSAVERGAQ